MFKNENWYNTYTVTLSTNIDEEIEINLLYAYNTRAKWWRFYEMDLINMSGENRWQ